MATLTWPSKSLTQPDPASLTLDSVIYPGGACYPDGPANSHLYLGDNLRVMAALLPEYEGSLDLIYADPPFFTNKRFSARIGRGKTRAARKIGNWQKATQITGMIWIPILISFIRVWH
jgi:hypothetical protein